MVKLFASSRYKINRKKIHDFAEDCLVKKRYEGAHVNIAFIGTRKMKSIAAQYKNEDIALPVLSFNYADPSLLGEVIICYPQVVLLAAERDKTIDKMHEILIEHGIENLIKST